MKKVYIIKGQNGEAYFDFYLFGFMHLARGFFVSEAAAKDNVKRWWKPFVTVEKVERPFDDYYPGTWVSRLFGMIPVAWIRGKEKKDALRKLNRWVRLLSRVERVPEPEEPEEEEEE